MINIPVDGEDIVESGLHMHQASTCTFEEAHLIMACLWQPYTNKMKTIFCDKRGVFQFAFYYKSCKNFILP